MTKAKINEPLPPPIQEETGPGLEAYLGQPILLMCQNYIYTGTLYGVFDDFVLLVDPVIVYETGGWSDKGYKNAEKLHAKYWRVMRSSIESYGCGK